MKTPSSLSTRTTKYLLDTLLLFVQPALFRLSNDLSEIVGCVAFQAVWGFLEAEEGGLGEAPAGSIRSDGGSCGQW
jgi:hypothetical protein